jgi:hypothetical protein
VNVRTGVPARALRHPCFAFVQPCRAGNV